jgi:hypothetical protein
MKEFDMVVAGCAGEALAIVLEGVGFMCVVEWSCGVCVAGATDLWSILTAFGSCGASFLS